MKISSIYIILLVSCLTMPAMAQIQPGAGPMNFSLNEAKQYALDNSPVLLNSARDIDIAKKKIWESTATGLPQISMSGTYGYSPAVSGLADFIMQIPGYENLDPNAFKTNFFASLQINQLIFSGQYIVGLRASKVYASLSELAESKSKTGILESITTTYFSVLVARESRKVLDSTLITVQKTLNETEQLYKNGFVEITDIDQLKITVSNIQINLSVAIRQIELMERLLKFQMGIPIDQKITLTDQIDPLVDVINQEAGSLDSFKVENNIDYQLLTTQEKLMQLDMQAEKAQFLPTFSGFYKRYADFDDNFFNDESPDMFGLSLSFPLFSSGQRLSKVSQKRVEYLKAQTNTEMEAENLLIQYETAISDFIAARDIVIMQKKNKDITHQIYQRTIIKFTEGIVSSLDLIQTQSQYFETQGAYFEALMSFVSAKAKLESLISGPTN